MSVVGCIYVEKEMEKLQELLDEMESQGVYAGEQLEKIREYVEETRKAAAKGYL